MHRVSMNEITTYRWSLEQDIACFSAAGYRAMGVWLNKIDEYGEDQSVELILDSELDVSNVLWTGGFTGSEYYSHEEGVSQATHALRLSAAMGAGCLIVHPGGRNNHTFRHAGRLLEAALDELLPVAEAVEVPLALEPMHPACAAEWTFLTDLEAALDFVESYNSPYLKLAYDTYQFSPSKGPHRLLEQMVPHLGIVYLGDRVMPPSIDQQRCLLGAGSIPLPQIVSTLIEAGYTGDFDVKLIGHEIDLTGYQEILDQSMDICQQLVAMYECAV